MKARALVVAGLLLFFQSAVSTSNASGSTTADVAGQSLYAQTTTTLQTASTTYVPIPGLTLTVPALTSRHKYGLITLDVPNILACHAFFGVMVGSQVVASGEVGSQGVSQTAIATRIPLSAQPQTVAGVWLTALNTCPAMVQHFTSLSILLVS
jgi:hypothetical protein